MKQGKEETEFVKDSENPKKKFIFQNNTKTKFGTYFIILVLVLLVIGIIISAMNFGNS